LALMITRAPGLMPQTRATPEETRRYLEFGLAAVGEEETVALVELLLAEGGWAFGFSDPPPSPEVRERMRIAAARAVSAAERLGRADLLSIALDVQHISHELHDDVRAMAAGVERRRGLADQVVAFIDLDDIFYMSAQVAWEQGRYRDALRFSEEGIARVAALGGESRGSSSTLALSQFLLGDWDAVVEESRRVIEDFGTEPPGFLRLVISVAEFVLAARHETGALEPLRKIELSASMRLSFRALGLGAEGRAEEGLALIRADVRPNEGRSFEMMAKAQLLETLGGFAELATLCTEIRERAQRAGWAAGPAMADRLDAARLLTEGDAAGAAELARSSADRFAETGAEWEAAVSRLTLAEALHALGRAGDAAAALAEAEPALRRAGAVAELERFAALSARG